MKFHPPLWLASCLLSVALAAACGTVEAPFEPSPDGAGGSGGTSSGGSGGGSGGSTSPTGGAQNGEAGSSTGGQSTEDGGSGNVGGLGGRSNLEILVDAASPVRGVAATETDLYWTEYGTEDDLANFLGNGSLNRMDIDSGDKTVVAGDLEGPISLKITTAEAYMILERSTVSTTEGRRDLGRIPLEGGSLELLENGGTYTYAPHLAARDDFAYLGLKRSSVWRIFELAPGEEPREVLPFHPQQDLAADETYLYYWDGPGDGLWRKALDGSAEPEELTDGEYAGLVLDGDRILTIRESGGGAYIAALPIDGGNLTNVQRIGDYSGCHGLVVRGQRFGAKCWGTSSGYVLATGILEDDSRDQAFSMSVDDVWAINEDYAAIASGTVVYGAPLD